MIGGSPGILMMLTSGGGGGAAGVEAARPDRGRSEESVGYTGAGAIPLLVLIVMIEPGIVRPFGVVPTTAPLDE